ncbi:hypothetical protein [Pedobacter immunditicola]|uniref:hypothetical protein n=1 Tax=Pedobacter immunditicola TaxID=3133440 RepID=UPI003099FC55
MDKNETLFFHRNWWLFYALLFLLIGLLVYAVLWNPNHRMQILKQQLIDCSTANVNTTHGNMVNCDAKVQSGGQGNTRTQHTLGAKSGKVALEYDTKSIPDEINVFYDGQLVLSTNGLVSSFGQLAWEYKAEPGKPDYFVVEVSAPTEDTAWEYIVNCPL